MAELESSLARVGRERDRLRTRVATLNGQMETLCSQFRSMGRDPAAHRLGGGLDVGRGGPVAGLVISHEPGDNSPLSREEAAILR